MYFKDQFEAENSKINAKINSQNTDIGNNRTSILRNTQLITKNAEEISKIKEMGVEIQEENGEISRIRQKAFWTLFKCQKEDYRNHTFGRMNQGCLKIYFTDVSKFCEVNYQMENASNNFTVKLAELQRQLSKGTGFSVRIAIDQKYVNINNKYSAVVRLTNPYSSRRPIMEKILENRNQHRNLLGVLLNIPDKFNIEEHLRILVEEHVDNEGNKVFIKSGTSRRGFFFVVLNDDPDSADIEQNVDIRDVRPENKNSIVTIMAPEEFGKISQKDLTIENMLKIKDYERFFYWNGKIYEKF